MIGGNILIMAAKLIGTKLGENVSKLRSAFLAGIDSVQPQELIKKFVERERDTLFINKKGYKLNENVYVVGFGKAVIGMVRPLETLLRESNSLSHLKGGIISVPIGIQNTFANRPHLLPSSDSPIVIMEGAKDNIPDEDAFSAAKEISSFIQRLGEKDILIVLISGGGSALLPYPLPPVTMGEKQTVVKSLSRAGADIIELNTVRKALSATKGGKLAALTKARTVSLILSDVINSPFDVIASGPTVVNRDPVGAALSVIEKYNILLPDHIQEVLRKTNVSCQELPHVTNLLIGSNETALSTLAESLSEVTPHNDYIVVLSSCLQGEASVVGKKMSELAAVVADVISGDGSMEELSDGLLDDLYVSSSGRERIVHALKKISKEKYPICLVFGGETTVHVCGKGQGGRNQEMVLSASINLDTVSVGLNLCELFYLFFFFQNS